MTFTGYRFFSRPIQLRHRANIAILAFLLTLLVFPAAGFTANDAVRVVTIQSALLDHLLVPGGSSRLVVSASILPGWHINSDHPLGEYYIPTQLTVKMPPVATAGAVTYPPAREVSLKFAAGEKLSVFNGNIQFAVPIKAATAFKADVGAPATVRIDYQACNDDQCLRPTSVDYKTDLASSGAPARLGDETGTASTDDQSDSDTSWSVAHVFARYGNVLGFLVVLLGGLALNLTPCVYPLIGVTVAYFGNEAGGARRVIALAILYVLGIALTFSAVGVAAALRAASSAARYKIPGSWSRSPPRCWRLRPQVSASSCYSRRNGLCNGRESPGRAMSGRLRWAWGWEWSRRHASGPSSLGCC